MDELNHESDTRSAFDFDALWNRDVQLLDEPNRRAGGTSSVGVADARSWPEVGVEGRVFVKRQQAFYCRPAWNGFRRTPTLRREVRFISKARALGVNVPDIVCYMEDSDRALLVLHQIDRACELERAVVTLGASERAEVFKNIGKTLTKMHSARILHGAIYPKHVFVEADAPWRIWLIDFEKARHVASRLRAAERDVARLMRHATFMTSADLEALVSGYDAREFPRLWDRLKD